jgi:glycerol-3-phosphate acyltransferase PlsY
MHEILFIGSAFLLGSIPFGYIVYYITEKKDIRSVGSGNIGATNLLRSKGKLAGLLTLMLDLLKGFIPVFYGLKHFDYPVIIILGAAAVVTGHIFPLFLKFKGGKGVATFSGAILAFSLPGFLVFLCAFLLMTWITKYVSAGSMAGVVAVFFFTLFTQLVEVSMILFAVTILIIVRHRSNLKKIFSGTENKISFKRNG